MKPPFSSWKYERGFLTARRGGLTHHLGYFESRNEAREVALSFLQGQNGLGGAAKDRLSPRFRPIPRG